MRITVGRLKTIIQEELNEYGMGKKPKVYKRDEDEEKEESSEEERPSTILDDLKQILEDWADAAPEYSDEELYRVYHQDIQKLVDKYEGKEEHDCEDHPDMSHEEWEAKQGEEKEENEEAPGEEKKESKPKKSKKSNDTGKKKKAFPYESKQLEQMVYQKLITALGDKE